MNAITAKTLFRAAALLQQASTRLTAFVYDHVDTTLLASEEVPVDPARRSAAAPGKAVVAGVEYHVHIPPYGPDEERRIRAAVARGRGWR
jgi:hypothetical protein